MSATPGGARLGEILHQDAGLSAADLARGLALARSEHCRLGAALVGLGLCTADQVATALARQKGVAAARDKHLDAIATETLLLVPPEVARRLCAVAVGIVRAEVAELVIAMRDPDDAAALAELHRVTGYKIRPAVACESRLRDVLDTLPEDNRPRRPSAPAPPEIDLTPPPRPLEKIAPMLDARESIDLTPTTLDVPVPAMSAPMPVSPVPAPGPSRPVIVKDELELEDVPRARRLSQPQPQPSARVPSRIAPMQLAHAPPVGGSILDEKPSAMGIPGWVVQLLGLGIAIAIGVFAYDQCRGGTELGGTPVRGMFHDDKLALTLRLPGAGWLEQPGLFGNELPQLGGSTRASVFMRGDDADHPDAAAMVVRVTQAGAFPAVVTSDQLQAGLDGMQSQASKLSNGAYEVKGLACETSTLGRYALGTCRGDGTVLGTHYDVRFLMWIPTTDDAMVIVYFDRKDGGEAVLELARSIRLD